MHPVHRERTQAAGGRSQANPAHTFHEGDGVHSMGGMILGIFPDVKYF
jgi:hypothetical protein